ncbi:hypothetical protein ES704_03001 [subsurface metagenome]|jgi:hypothetical protein
MTTQIIKLSADGFKHIKKQDRFVLIEALRRLYEYSELRIAYAFGYSSKNALAVWISRNMTKYNTPKGFYLKTQAEIKELALEIIERNDKIQEVIKKQNDNKTIMLPAGEGDKKVLSKYIPESKKLIRIPTYSEFIDFLKENPNKTFSKQLLKNCEESDRKHWRVIVMAVIDVIREMV